MVSKKGRPATDTEAVMVRMPRDLLDKIDGARRAAEDLPSRPEVIRRIVTAWFAQGGSDPD